jgi:hypothetical protein
MITNPLHILSRYKWLYLQPEVNKHIQADNRMNDLEQVNQTIAVQ